MLMKKYLKKTLSFILVLTLVLSLFSGLTFTSSALSSSGKCGDYVNYTFDSATGTLRIFGRGDMYYYDGNSPFRNQKIIKIVIVEDSITSIEAGTFEGCNDIKELTVPASAEMYNSAFYNCTNIEKVTLTKGTGKMHDYDISYYSDDCLSPWYFSRNSLKEVLIENGVKTIGNNAFYSCSSLTSVTIPNTVSSIGVGAFDYCSGLTSITIPNSVITIGLATSGSGATFSSSTFYGCTGLTKLTIPASAKIGNGAFNGCSNIEKVTLTGYASMRDYAISIPNDPYYEDSYRKDTYYKSTPWYESRDKIREIIIEDGVKSIGSYAFYDCSGLTSITIPDSVTSISKDAFYGTGYYNISENWESNVLYIGNHLIKAKGTLSGEYTVKSGTKTIADSAFSGCSGLKELTMPCSAIIYNSETTFGNCTNIKKITLTKGTGTMQNYGTSTSSGASNTYYNYTPWHISRNNLKELIIEDGVESIGSYAFKDCSGLKSIKIPNSVTSVGYSAFSGCNSLTTATIGNSVASIGNNAFDGCNNLNNITIPDSVTSVGYSAFSGCNSLTTATIGNSVASIGNNAFDGCNKLNNIIIPDSVTRIGDYAFKDCSSLTTATIGNLVTYINNTVFSNCNNISSLTIGTGMETIDKTAFTNLNQITLPANLAIDFTCFDNCENIQTINISCGNGKMADWSMDYENSLWYLHRDTVKEINLEEGVTEISESAFYNCTNLMKTTVPSTVKRIGSYAYSGCNNLRNITIYSLDCVIPDNPNTIDSFATIYGYDNSTAQAYAQKYNRTFISLGEYVCKEHNYTAKNISAKANAIGYTLHTCSRCGKTFKDNFTNPTGKPKNFKLALRTATAEKFTWTKTAGVNGYQVQLLNSAGKSAGTATTTGNAYTFSKLAAGHAYKARVRFYIKAADGKNYYGAWSTINSPTLPAGTSLTKVTPAKKAFTAQWKKGTVTGYQLQYSTNAKFSKATTKTIKGAAKVKLAVKSLKGNTKYFVRVRTYKTIYKVNHYSTWSGAKSVKTK